MSNTPEHEKRETGSPELLASYEYVERVVHTADVRSGQDGYYPAWHGWALREAFLAGISYANSKRTAE